MAPDLRLQNPDELKNLVAAHIVSTSTRGRTPRVEHLAANVNEITLETETLGSSLLQVSLTDPGWEITNAGFLSMDSSGLLDAIDVNFPEGSSMWWRLAMVDFSDSLSAPNLKLTFQDRIISYLQDKFGPKGVAPGTTTRAQFIKQLVDEVGKGDGLEPIKFVCHALNVVQPVQPTTTGSTTTVLSPGQASAKGAKANKSGGIGAGSGITIKGQRPTATQLALVNQVMGIAQGLGAGRLATEALLEACIQENNFTNSPSGGGLLQFEASTAASLGIHPLDVNQCVTAFLTKSYARGMAGYSGAIDYANKNPKASADQVAQAAQGSAFPLAYGQWLGEADKIIQAYGGAYGTALSTGNAGGGTSDVSQLTRGTTENPDESSWECIQRLASEVNWMAFSNGDTLYYDDGPTLDSQSPALHLRRDDNSLTWTAINPPDGRTRQNVVSNFDATIDNTMFLNQGTRKRHGKIQRATRIRKPQTPTQIRFDLTCGIVDYRAGDVFVLENAGPFTGKWIVEDATRNCLADTFTQVTLGPPTYPNPEPASTSTGTSTPAVSWPGAANGKVSAPGTAAGAAQAARAALARQKSSHCFHYSQRRPIQYGILSDKTVNIDCSGFAIACYKAAGLGDPSHNNYNGSGYTGDMITHCTRVAAGSASPGDLCFFGGGTSSTTHVNVYVGNGQSVSMGQEGDPSIGPAASMGPSGFLGYWRPDTAKGGGRTVGAGISSTGRTLTPASPDRTSSIPSLF